MSLLIGPILSVTAAPLAQVMGNNIRKAVAHVSRTSVRAVQLSAAMAGMRPRELDQRARRDVLAMLARSGLALSGLDLMIPHKHWSDPAQQQRAVDATLSAIALAADMGRVALSVSLPIASLATDIRKELLTAADGHGVTLAIHAEDELDALAEWLNAEDQPALKAAIDPAALLAMNIEPADAVIQLAKHIHTARLDDFARTSIASAGGRRAIGQGDMDVTHYRAALSTINKLSTVCIELRDVRDPQAALNIAIDN